MMHRNIPFFYTLYNVITIQYYMQMVHSSFQPCLKTTNTCSNKSVINFTTRATRKTVTSTSCINTSPQDYNHPPEDDEEENSRSHNHLHEYFPVLSQIAGINWKGNCTYIDTNLSSISNLKLSGGVRFDVNAIAGTVQMSSFIEFPNGKVREIIMKGQKNTTNSSSHVLDLYPPVGTTNGPIYMKITELLPDTILFHELERSTDKMILTGSLSIVQQVEGGGDGGGGVGVTRTELVQISHELAGGGTNDCTIQGHQVWRYTYI